MRKPSAATGLVFQRQQLTALKLRQRECITLRIQKLNLKHIRRKLLHDRAHLAGDQAFGRLIFKQGDNFKELDRGGLHFNFSPPNLSAFGFGLRFLQDLVMRVNHLPEFTGRKVDEVNRLAGLFLRAVLP